MDKKDHVLVIHKQFVRYFLKLYLFFHHMWVKYSHLSAGGSEEKYQVLSHNNVILIFSYRDAVVRI